MIGTMEEVEVFDTKFENGHWVKYHKGYAKFLHWGINYDEFESGPGHYTAAIVMWPDGTIDYIRANLIKFVNGNLIYKGE
jgi:hypothetical protein